MRAELNSCAGWMLSTLAIANPQDHPGSQFQTFLFSFINQAKPKTQLAEKTPNKFIS